MIREEHVHWPSEKNLVVQIKENYRRMLRKMFHNYRTKPDDYSDVCSYNVPWYMYEDVDMSDLFPDTEERAKIESEYREWRDFYIEFHFGGWLGDDPMDPINRSEKLLTRTNPIDVYYPN